VDVRVLAWAGAPLRVIKPTRRMVRAQRSRFVDGTRVRHALENQFLWSPEVCAVLADKLSHPPADGFRVVVLLPERANNGQDDTRGQLGVLVEADKRGGGGRFLATTIRSRSGDRSERLYVHAKVGIVDDRWLTVGSANVNAHSFFNDSEVNVVTCDQGLARETRLRLWVELPGVSRRAARLRGPLDALVVDG
jgi:phosphatidylserine/phosphatidylglycerophosphate/cardiolipin synthase-like enzyme